MSIVIIGVLLCGAVWWLLHEGTRKIVDVYHNTNFAQRRGLESSLQVIASRLESRQKEPPQGEPAEFHVDFNDWGYPLQYGWENGVAVVRAAGRDRKLHTPDDVTYIVHLNKEKDGTSTTHRMRYRSSSGHQWRR
jgi:hypothetical protein